MTNPEHFIWRHKTAAHIESYLHSGDLPPVILEKSRKRVAKLTLFFGAMYVLSVPLYTAAPQHFTDIIARSPLNFLIAIASVLVGIMSFALYRATRLERITSKTILRFAMGWEVLVAFNIAMVRHVMPWEQAHYVDWSEVAVWIIIFSFVVPNTPRRTLLFALLAACMDPLCLMLHVAAGNPMPSATSALTLLGPTFASIVIVVVFAQTIYRLGLDVHEARQMGSYQLLKRIGKGGMGEVWMAEHRLLARPAAVKLIPRLNLDANSEGSEIAIRRFEQEAHTTASLESDHTIQLYDFGSTDDGSFFYVMEYLDGFDLDELVTRFGPLAPERVVYVLLQVCDSLAEAHANGLIHRDIKPANIYVCRKGLKVDYVKVLDFGLVKKVVAPIESAPKLTIEGQITGTPAFLAPEAVIGEKQTDGRTDIYSLGCVAYWMLSGQLVFDSSNAMKIVLDHVRTTPPSLSSRTELEIPVDLEKLIHRCLEKDPDDRPQTAQELANELSQIKLDNQWTQQRAHRWWNLHFHDETNTG